MIYCHITVASKLVLRNTTKIHKTYETEFD